MTDELEPAAVSGDLLQPVLDDLELVSQTELADQVAIFERVHSALTQALATTVDQPGPAAGGR